jgi:hypothetical protein
MPVVKIADVIVPEIFTPYQQLRTTQLSAIINAGVAARDAALDALLAGAGLTFNVPSWNDLDHDDDENVSNDDDTDESAPSGTKALEEIGVRLSRNKSWGAMRLVAALAGVDPMQSIGNLVSDYWIARMQSAFVAAMQGVFADNDAAPSGNEHVAGDLTVDISDDAAGSYSAGVTDFSADAFIDACTTLGDGAAGVTAILVHSIVYARMQKNNLIDFIPDSQGQINIPVFLGRRVIIDDGMPNPAGKGAAQTSAGVYHSWLMGPGVARIGVGTAEVPTEVERKPSSGKGAGQDILHSRVEWMIHPIGHKYAGTPPKGGPSNASTANNLAAAGSWQRVYPERKQIKIARLVSRES